MMNMTELELAQMIDHTLLKPYATEEQLKQICDECKTYHFKMAAINSGVTAFIHEQLKGSGVHTGAAISFPLGTNTIEAKLYETKDAIQNGADEIDYVLNIAKLKQKDYDYIEQEMRQMTELCHSSNILIKVIFENCYLEKEEIKAAAEIALKVRPDFIKTSTGFGTSGATAEDVRLMKSVVKDAVQVKAAGGIKDLQTAEEMILAGATRIGTSHGVELIQQLRERNS
jgi:deoxyribose-phosphate aldolase